MPAGLDIATASGLDAQGLSALASLGGVVLGEGYVLVSFWKPLLILPPLIIWASLVSSVFDKQAQRFFLGREKWNAVHLGLGVLAAAVFFLMPIQHWSATIAGFFGACLVLLIDVVVFVKVTNADERVPEHQRIDLAKSAREGLRAWQEKRKGTELEKSVSLVITGPRGRFDPPAKDTPEYELRIKAEQLFIKAATTRGEQVRVQPTRRPETYAMQTVVFGVAEQAEPLPATDAVPMIDFWKAAAGMDVTDRRRKQIASLKVRPVAAAERDSSTETEVRVTTSGSQAGMQLMLELDPVSRVRIKAEQLGLMTTQLETLKAIVADGTGVVLLAAPPDQGRTPLMYSVIKLHDAYTSNVQTFELEPEDTLEGVRQNVFDPKGASEYSINVRTHLRRDPDVLAIADLPDTATASEVMRADHERTRVYVCLPQPDAVSAIQAWMKLAGGSEQAAACLRGVVAARRMRRLCENCRVPYQPSAELLKSLNLPADRVRQLFRKGGQVLIKNKPATCPVCMGRGFDGQTGLFEVFPLDAEARDLIGQKNWKSLIGTLRKAGHRTLQDAGIIRSVEGLTSLDEVTRVLRPEAAKKSGEKASGGEQKQQAAGGATA